MSLSVKQRPEQGEKEEGKLALRDAMNKNIALLRKGVKQKYKRLAQDPADSRFLAGRLFRAGCEQDFSRLKKAVIQTLCAGRMDSGFRPVLL